MTCSARRLGLLLWVLVAPLAALAVNPPPNTWTLRASGTTRKLTAVVFGKDTFVAVGLGGTILTSPDGVAWTARRDVSGLPEGAGAPFTRDLYGVAYSAIWNVFVAVGDAGTIVYSEDRGITWSLVSVPSFGEPIQSVTTGGALAGRFVAVGRGFVATALMGTGPWTVRWFAGADLMAVASNGDTTLTGNANPAPFYVAVGGGGRVLVSSDALQWHPVVCDYPGNLVSVARSMNDSFEAIGYETTASGPVDRLALIDHSPGAAPTCVTQGTPVTPAGSWDMHAIAFGSPYATDDYGVVAGTSDIYVSRFGSRREWSIAWRGKRGETFNAVAYGRGSFVAVGSGGIIYQSTSGGSGSVDLGCFTDDANRALPIQLIRSGATVESCLAAATSRQLTYFGLQWYGTCYGAYAPGYARDEGQCTTPCTASSAETCGGAWHNSVHTTGVQLLVPAYSERGCYFDDSSRMLDARLIDSGATVESCIAAARARGFPYAGVQWYGQCFAGDTPGTRDWSAASCNTPCDANPSEICGGAWRNSVYATGATQVSVSAPSSLFVGCYTDDANRALPAEIISSGATVETCLAAAKTMGYAYAGLQWRGTCYAGNAPGYTRVATVPNQSPCNLPCDADPSETCGGEWYNAVYATPP